MKKKNGKMAAKKNITVKDGKKSSNKPDESKEVESTVKQMENETVTSNEDEIKTDQSMNENDSKANDEDKPEPGPQEIIENLNSELAKLRDQMLRERAEFENYKRRRANEIHTLGLVANEDIILSLLPVLDDLDLLITNSQKNRDLKGIVDGAKLIQQKFADILKRRGLKEIEASGKKFDPEFHEALLQLPDESVESDTILEVHQKGFTLGGKLLRPSRVIIASSGE